MCALKAKHVYEIWEAITPRVAPGSEILFILLLSRLGPGFSFVCNLRLVV